LIDHKIQCWKNTPSLFSLALLENFISQRKPLAFCIGIKTPILKQPHPHYLDILAQALQLTHNSKRHTIPYD
jgi:hypothetical protein